MPLLVDGAFVILTRSGAPPTLDIGRHGFLRQPNVRSAHGSHRARRQAPGLAPTERVKTRVKWG